MSIVGRLRDGLRRTARRWTSRLERLSGTSGSGDPSAETLEALEELLIEADVGVLTAGRIVARVGEDGAGDLRDRVKTEIRGVLAGVAALPVEVPSPRVVLVVGVNGTGKTTTVGKLAHRCRLDGRTPLICAADTFRAAAVEQIAVWAERASVDIVRAADGADPAAVVFDAISAARARGRDVVFVDTAGRLHTRADLMGELGKIRRVAGRAAAGAPHEVLLVVDASVGQNGISQARRFLETAGVTGIVLTKLDGTAKGGVAVAIAGELGVPIRYVGVGEGIDDLLPFSAGDYVDALFEKAW
ncbi:MAG: signal recognition particle-docking protein FtsY [Acidobacteria bacterium]|nr:signal recognition particle-docking protein FtsY [Acidobacteriota bacterium]